MMSPITSTYRHKIALIAEKGSPIGLKEVFDRTHMVKTPTEKAYVNENEEKAVEKYLELKKIHGDTMEDDKIWEMAVEGEDKRGRLFGFGFRSRTSKATRVLETVEGAPSAKYSKRKYTKEEVAGLLRAERTEFVAKIDEQDKRHTTEIIEIQKNNQITRKCFLALFRANGLAIPYFLDGSSMGNDGVGGDT